MTVALLIRRLKRRRFLKRNVDLDRVSQYVDGSPHPTLDVPTNTCLERAEVFNLSGQRVHEEAFSKGLGSQTMDVSRLPNGAYHMIVHFSDHTRVAKFMVER